jgi:hypothetical protein
MLKMLLLEIKPIKREAMGQLYKTRVCLIIKK